MADRTPIPLTPVPVSFDDEAFRLALGWPYPDPFVPRLLNGDTQRRCRYGAGRVWLYCDPDGVPVGFGTLDYCNDWSPYTGGLSHFYIPLLAVNPTVKSRGYGTAIVNHLVGEAALQAAKLGGQCHELLFLDVYTSSTKAIEVYTNCGFTCITSEPLADADDNNKLYLVMAKRVAVAPA